MHSVEILVIINVKLRLNLLQPEPRYKVLKFVLAWDLDVLMTQCITIVIKLFSTSFVETSIMDNIAVNRAQTLE